MCKKISFWGTILLGLSLSACAPFVDSRREAGQSNPVGQSTKNRLAICYNPLWTKDATLQSMADETCAPRGKKAIPDGTRSFNCTFTAPNTAFFKCE